jgi:hypothetical protein
MVVPMTENHPKRSLAGSACRRLLNVRFPAMRLGSSPPIAALCLYD